VTMLLHLHLHLHMHMHLQLLMTELRREEVANFFNIFEQYHAVREPPSHDPALCVA
jgi:hypothetical protein